MRSGERARHFYPYKRRTDRRIRVPTAAPLPYPEDPAGWDIDDLGFNVEDEEESDGNAPMPPAPAPPRASTSSVPRTAHRQQVPFEEPRASTSHHSLDHLYERVDHLRSEERRVGKECRL